MIKSRERYQEIFTQSKDALFICTLEGKFIDFNQATIDLFKYNTEELLALEDVHSLYQPVERKNEFLLKLKILLTYLKITRKVKGFSDSLSI